MRRLSTIILPALLTMAGAASAQTVYTQPGTEACNPSCWTSHYDAVPSGYRAFDNFTLGSAASITSVSWQGIYIPLASQPTAPSPDTTSWVIDFFSDSSNFPGTSLFSATLPAASVTTTQIGTGTFGSQPVNLYAFTATLPSAFAAAGGTQYWFSPLSLAPTFDPFFSWSPATLVYDGLTTQTDTNGNNYYRPNDRAFSLDASAVPEPASWAMMIVGFGAAGAAMRRRRVRVRFA